MCVLILLAGIATESWYAEFAFRRRVSMSAIGSVMVMMAVGLSHRGFRQRARRALARSTLGAAGTCGVVEIGTAWRKSGQQGARPDHFTGLSAENPKR